MVQLIILPRPPLAVAKDQGPRRPEPPEAPVRDTSSIVTPEGTIKY